MFDRKAYDDLAKKLGEAIPEKFKHLKADTEKTFRNVLQSTMSKLDLITREEFDVQTAVLAKTRKKVEALEKQVAVLEEKLGIKHPLKPKTKKKSIEE